MTNFEWIKNDDKRLKDVLIHGLAVNADTDRMERCCDTPCCGCSFNAFKHKLCQDQREEWLQKEYRPLYKKGDIVTTKAGNIYIVIGDVENDITVSDNTFSIDSGIGVLIDKDVIRQKIGNMLDNCDKKEV